MRWVPLGGVAAGAIALNLLGGSALATSIAKTPKPADVTAARTVVRTITRFDQTALHREGAMTAAAKAMVAEVQAGCAGTIPSTIPNGTNKQQGVYLDLILESAVDLAVRAIQPLAHPAIALAKGLDGVRFSKRTFTRGLHDTAKAQRLLLGIKPSDLCTDVKAAAAGGFDTDAPGTTAFLQGVARLNPGPTVTIPNVLKRIKPDLLTKSDRDGLARLKKVDAQYQGFSTNLGLKWGAELGKVLAAPPASGGTGGTGGFPTNPPPPPTTTAMTAAFATF